MTMLISRVSYDMKTSVTAVLSGFWLESKIGRSCVCYFDGLSKMWNYGPKKCFLREVCSCFARDVSPSCRRLNRIEKHILLLQSAAASVNTSLISPYLSIHYFVLTVILGSAFFWALITKWELKPIIWQKILTRIWQHFSYLLGM